MTTVNENKPASYHPNFILVPCGEVKAVVKKTHTVAPIGVRGNSLEKVIESINGLLK